MPYLTVDRMRYGGTRRYSAGQCRRCSSLSAADVAAADITYCLGWLYNS